MSDNARGGHWSLRKPPEQHDRFAAGSGKNSNILVPPGTWRLSRRFTPEAVEGHNTMYDVCQLATAILAIAFTALLLITGQRFIESRLQRDAMPPIVAMATLPP
ncbi:hypothetical protein [Bradyrhizobium sp. CB1015]|uniref:hypothetical protein n=1 Tax=Bradyrhizobium sp. CB1015 TaxID=2976822 RepID=UPI0021AA2D3B|nr:hypothetical protein [Bradyrhizobium sp. CB1015]UWU88843.1 hypothetical protein N2604_20080 [Bradyrhizobium sp. CB1015]